MKNKKPTQTLVRSAHVANHASGFTLIEVMAAMGIMSAGFAAILMIQTNSLRSAGKSKEMGEAAQVLRTRMFESELETEGHAFSEVAKESEGECPEPFKDWNCKRIIREVEFPNLMQASDEKNEDSLEARGPTAIAQKISKTMTAFINKSVREVTVTVTRGDSSYSVSSYWVSLNEDLPIQ